MTCAYTHSLHFFKVPELRELCKLCHDKDSDVNITTRKLALVSLMTVFKDIIPG